MFENRIWVEKGFQTSINIAYDLNDEDKIKRFIPTTSSLEFIEDVMLSTMSPEKGRARLFIGAYGKGKSHITLMIMSLLSKKNTALFTSFLKRVELYDVRLCNFINEYINSDKKLLPVVISGSSTSITQSFLGALESALARENLSDLMPETHFLAAINTISLWKNEYVDTYQKFLRELNIDIDEYLIKLKEYDVQAYEKFENIFPKLTSGSVFNPFLGFDVVEIYEKIVEKLKDREYSGVYIIYDEFSKYLESSIGNATISDIKLLQDFAEKCNRSGNKEMHLMLISHKDITNYIDNKLPKEKVDGWRGVSGRFKHMNFHNNFNQMYEIIASVIKKEPDFWNSYYSLNKRVFDDMSQTFNKNGLFDDEYEVIKDIANGCYPMHLVSAFILPRLSEKVAQNERTLFTFLSADSRDTLSSYLENVTEQFPLLTPDIIYDYFEPLIRKEPYTSEIFKLYETTKKAIVKFSKNDLKVKIIKSLTLVYIVEQFEKLAPTRDYIIDTFKYSVNDIREIEQAISELIDENFIIYLKRSNGYLKIKETSGEDIVSTINKLVEKSKLKIELKEILNQTSYDSFLYPTAYNDENEIVRYFDFKFIDSKEFFSVNNWDEKIKDTDASGVVFAIIASVDDDILKIKDFLQSGHCNNNRVLFVLPNEFYEIEDVAYEYYSAKILRDGVEDDEILYDEYNLYIDDLEEVLTGYIQNFIRPENGKSIYFYDGVVEQFRRKAQLSAKLSQICQDTYINTPIIKNESLNKDLLPSVAINSRNRLISNILIRPIDKNLGLQGTGQEVSFMRSSLIQTGVLIEQGTETLFTLTPANELMARFLNEIYSFINTATDVGGKSFKILYSILTNPAYGYGIKKGVIPIYLAVVLSELNENIMIKHLDNEIKLTVDVLNSINEKPEDYFIYIENWSAQKSQYIKGLEVLFKSNVNLKEKEYGSFAYVTNGISRWYMSLPRYAKDLKKVYNVSDKEFKRIKREDLKFISLIKQSNGNSRELLFDKFVKAYNFIEFDIEILENIESIKNLLDNAKDNLLKMLIDEVINIFIKFDDNSSSLTSVVKSFIEPLKQSTLNYLYANGEHRVLEVLVGVSNDEFEFIEKLAKVVTGLRIDDWSDDTAEKFLSELSEIKNIILNKDNIGALENNEVRITQMNNYVVAFYDETGKEVKRTFEKINYSPRGQLLFNQIKSAIDDMGQSITEQEKRQILMEFIEKFC